MLIELFFSAVIFFAFITIIRRVRPVANREGGAINAKKATINEEAPQTLTVATFNIQTGKSLQGKRDIKRAAQAICKADIVGVQEVYAPGFLNKLGFGDSQPHTLAKLGGFNSLLSATQTRWLREHRGNLLLSKLPISNWKVEQLPDFSGRRRYRNMTVAKIAFQDNTFHFINTHLHTSKGRIEQLEIVLNEFDKYSNVILVGDFNSMPETPQLKELLKDRNICDAIGSMNIDENESQRIDWILTKGFTVQSAQIIEKGISDHPYYEVVLSLT